MAWWQIALLCCFVVAVAMPLAVLLWLTVIEEVRRSLRRR